MIDSIQHAWAHLPDSLKQNQFFSGGFILGAVGLLGALFRKWVPRGVALIKRQFMLEMTFNNDDPVFEWIVVWLNDQPAAQRVRSVAVTLKPDSSLGPRKPLLKAAENDTRPQLLVTPGLGTHLLFHRGRPLWLTRSAADAKDQGSMDTRRKEVIHIRMVARSRKLIEDLLTEIRDFAVPPREPKTRVHLYTGYTGWKTIRQIPANLARSVVLPDDTLESLAADVQRFKSSRAWYQKQGIPYRRGFLLHGVSGAGKTSTVLEVARLTGHDLAVLPMASPFFDDSQLQNAMLSLPPNCFVLFEDVDCITTGREMKSAADASVGRGVSFHGFLNAIDGVLACDGTITWMSTNHRDKLDHALIRPGRVDREVEYLHATAQQATKLFHNFFPGSNGTGEKFGELMPPGTAMCRIQTHLLQHRDDPQAALEHVADLAKPS